MTYVIVTVEPSQSLDNGSMITYVDIFFPIIWTHEQHNDIIN